MLLKVKNRIPKDEFIKICNESLTMSEACSKLNMHFNSFKRLAIKYNCYNPNQGSKGIKRIKKNKIKTIDIINGKYPNYQTYKLKQRLLTEGYMINKCFECNIENWNNKPLNMELHHIDGNKYNNKLDNLKLLCPNCHAQTNTYRSKNNAPMVKLE